MTNAVQKAVLMIAAGALFFGCGAPQNVATRGDLDSLVFDPSAQNVAVLLGSDGGNLDGVPVDIRGLKSMLSDTATGFNFTVMSEERNASVRMAKDMLKQAAAQVGDRGTLLIYYSGHGAAGSGCMAFTDDCITFSSFAKAIQEVRSTPIKRLLFFSDSCFSGQLVTGNSAIISNGSGSPLGGSESIGEMELTAASRVAEENVALSRAGDDWYTALATAFVGGSGVNPGSTSSSYASRGFEKTLFEQALTVAAARPNETSADLGPGGGAFTSALRRAFAQLKGSSATTIRQFLEKTARDTQSNGHTPVYRAFPSDVVLNDTLTGAPTNIGPTVTQPQAINIMLGQSADANAVVLGAADPSIAYMSICNGDKALCSSVTRDDIVLKKATVSGATNNRVFFYSEKPVAMSNGYIFTLQGKDATGKPVISRTVRIVKQ